MISKVSELPPAAGPSIRPETVTSPFQLLGAWLVFIIVLDGSFLAAAATVDRPHWASGVLVVAAVVNVPLLLALIFLLQTRFRPQLQADTFYSEYIRAQRQTEDLSVELGRRLDANGLGLADLVAGRSIADLSRDARVEIERLLERVTKGVEQIERTAVGPGEDGLSAEAQFEIARGLLADRRWLEAANHLESYANARPDDWEAHFSRGVALANSRSAEDANRKALRAYNDALAYLPDQEREIWLPRVLAYRGAMLKRLGRLDEAESDLLLAKRATNNPMEKHDIDYNLAAVYAMTGESEQAMELLSSLRGTQWMSAVHAHADDYFESLADEPEFGKLLRTQ